MKNLKWRVLALVLAFALVLPNVPLIAHAEDGSYEIGDTVVGKEPEAVSGAVWVSSLTCEENDHTHTEACYTKVCDHKDGHLSTCYSTSEYAFCTHENDSEHSGTISITEVVTFNGTKPTEVGTYDITAIAFGENYNVVVDSGVLTITHDWSDFQHDDTNHWCTIVKGVDTFFKEKYLRTVA